MTSMSDAACYAMCQAFTACEEHHIDTVTATHSTRCQAAWQPIYELRQSPSCKGTGSIAHLAERATPLERRPARQACQAEDVHARNNYRLLPSPKNLSQACHISILPRLQVKVPA